MKNKKFVFFLDVKILQNSLNNAVSLINKKENHF